MNGRLRSHRLDGRAALGVHSAAYVAFVADGRGVRDEEDRERARVAPTCFETAAIAGGSVGEAIDRVEQSLTARHSRNAMSRPGRSVTR